MDATSICPACGSGNPPDAKFCGSCGSALAATCPRCAHPNPVGTRFCTECGGALAEAAVDAPLTSRPAHSPVTLDRRAEVAEERKLITVLFADVAGYTSISEQLDPEETREMMRRAFDLMLEEVHRYEGTVSQLLGDGMLVLFGAPVAHEDHARRAIRAGLAIQEGLRGYSEELDARGIDFRVRIGIHSGLVVFGQIGTDLEFTFQAVGDTVNTASRVQGLASPGSVVVSDSTERLAEGFFEFEDLGRHGVKNKAEPIHVFRAVRPTGSRSRVEISAAHGLSAFVGRDREIASLAASFAEARSGRGRIVFISGEAGLGKSRLLHEFRSTIVDPDVSWITGRCISYGRESSYTPVIDLLRDAASIDEADDDVAIEVKLRALVETAGTDAAVLPYLRMLLSIDARDDQVASLEPATRKGATFDAIRDLVVASADGRPNVIVVEDLHWIDALSLELLSYLADVVPERSLLLLLTHRADWEPPFGDLPHLSRLTLHPLTEDDAGRVAVSSLFAEAMPSALPPLLLRKAEGNPFFVEELVKSLVESGALRDDGAGVRLTRPIQQIEVPDTVQDVIMARLDRLPEDSRQALQTASVIGREFTARLLERTARLGPTEARLGELKAAQLVFERSLYPELVFMFKHALTHEVAYGSLLVQRRRELHGVVGEAIEELYADRLPELYEQLAHHFELAERWDKAARYLTFAAEKAFAAAAVEQVVSFADRGVDAVERSGGDTTASIRLLELQGQAFTLMNEWDKAASACRRWVEATRAAGDRAAEGGATAQLAIVFTFAHRFTEALEVADEAEALGRDSGDETVRAGALAARITVLAVTGQVDEAYAELYELERIGQAGLPSDLKAIALDMAGELYHWRGDERAAIERLDESLAVGRERNSAAVLTWVLWDRSLSLISTGEYDDAVASLAEHQALCERLGDRFWWCRSENTAGWLYYDICNVERAIERNRRGIEESRKTGDPEILRNAQLNLADCLLARGDAVDAGRSSRTWSVRSPPIRIPGTSG